MQPLLCVFLHYGMLSNVLFMKNTSIPSFSLHYLLSASKGDKKTATISLPQLCIQLRFQSKSGSKEDLQSPTDKAMVENTAKKKKERSKM